jgi:PAS domain S-box-containing protein
MKNRFDPDQSLSALSNIFDGSSDASARLIADAIPQIVWVADPDGNVEYCNRAWLDFSGLTFEESLGQGWESALHHDDLDRCREYWMKAIQTGAAYENECRFRRAADSRYRWFLIRAHALKDDTGAIIKWVGSSTDIDDQKVAQHALREAIEDVERQVKERTAELLTTNMQLLDAISERRRAAAMQEQDTQRLNDIIATQALLVQAGLSLPSFLNLAAQKIHRLTGATGTAVELIEGNEVVSAAASGSTVPFIGFRMNIVGSLSGLCIRKRQVLKCDDATNDPRVDLVACSKVGAVSLVVAPLYNKGVAIGALKILSDAPAAFGQRDVQTLELMAGLLGAAIAQQVHIQSNERLLAERADALSALQAEIENRLRSEQQLREAEQRTRVLLESSHDAFFSMNSEGVIVDWNGQSESLFGWLRQEAAGKQFAALLIPEHARPGLSAELEQIIGSIETPAFKRRIELTALHRLGSSISIELSISSIRDGAEQLAYVFIRDIGRHK